MNKKLFIFLLLVLAAVVPADAALFKLSDAGTEDIVNYEKYGRFENGGTKDYKYVITDPKGLADAVGEDHLVERHRAAGERRGERAGPVVVGADADGSRAQLVGVLLLPTRNSKSAAVGVPGGRFDTSIMIPLMPLL